MAAASRRALAAGVVLALGLLAVWLASRSTSFEAEPDAEGRRLDDPSTEPLTLNAPERVAGAARGTQAEHTVLLRVTSECGGGPLAAAVCSRGTTDPRAHDPWMAEIVAGPSGANGVVELNLPVPAPRGGAAGNPESLLLSAPGYEARSLDDLLREHPTANSIEVQLAKVTRIVGEMRWPPGWLGHVRPEMVVVGLAPASDGASWTARSITLAEDGRSFHGDVHGCGRFWVRFSYILDDEEAGTTATVEIDARTGPEIQVAMQPSAQARQPATASKHRWTISVTDEAGSPVDGATVNAMSRAATSLRPVPGSWETNRDGEAVRDVAAGRYFFTVRKQGWATAFGSSSFDGEHRDVVRLVPATTKLIVRFTQTPSGAPESVFFELRQRAPAGDPWMWHPLENRGSVQASGQIEFAVAKGHEYAIFASGRQLAPVAERVARIGPEDDERMLDLSIGAGDTVEVRGLELEPTATPIGVQIAHEGVLGEILTATPQARFADGRWTMDHVSSAAGQAQAEVRGRRLRGSLAAASKEPRVLELR